MFKRIKEVALEGASTNQELLKKLLKDKGYYKPFQPWAPLMSAALLTATSVGAWVVAGRAGISAEESMQAFRVSMGTMGAGYCAMLSLPLLKYKHKSKWNDVNESVADGYGQEKNVKLSDYVKATAQVLKDQMTSFLTGRKVETNKEWKPSSTVVRSNFNENENRQKMIR
jgi:hypothetical protein